MWELFEQQLRASFQIHKSSPSEMKIVLFFNYSSKNHCTVARMIGHFERKRYQKKCNDVDYKLLLEVYELQAV